MTQSNIEILQNIIRDLLVNDPIEKIAPEMGLSDTTLRTIRDGKGNVSRATLEKIARWLYHNGMTTKSQAVSMLAEQAEAQRQQTLHVDTVERRELTIELQKLGDADEISRVSGVKRSEISNLYRVRRPAEPETVPLLFAWLRENHPTVASRLDETIRVKSQHKMEPKANEAAPLESSPTRGEILEKAVLAGHGLPGPAGQSVAPGALMASEVLDLLSFLTTLPADLVGHNFLAAIMAVVSELDQLWDLGQLSRMEASKRDQMTPALLDWIQQTRGHREAEVELQHRQDLASARERADALGKENEELMGLLRQARQILEQGRAMSEVIS